MITKLNLFICLLSVGIPSAIMIIIILFKKRFKYWSKMGLDSIDASIPFGSTKKLLLGKTAFGEQIKLFYNVFKIKKLKHGGAYLGLSRLYIPTDIEIIKNILQKDFEHFVNHGLFVDQENDPFTANLFVLEDVQWRNLRVKLTPTFTSGKIKTMFSTIANCAIELKDIMDNAVENDIPIEIKDVLARLTTDIIASTAFGLECNSLKNPNNPFRMYGKRNFEDTAYERFKGLLSIILPRRFLKMIKFKLAKPDVENFFTKVVKDNVQYREKNNIYRKDFMHLLIQLKNQGTITDDEVIIKNGEKATETGLTMNELTAQAFVFFVGGFESSSAAMAFALYELAIHPQIQEKVRTEIIRVLKKHNNEVSYDAIMEMTYLDQVFSETLRKYPPVPVLTRRCNKKYKVPQTDIMIEKGVDVYISILGIHNDPEFYPNPSIFDPERFSEENKQTIPAFSWLPFGEGPRICIGSRFSSLQSKVGLTTLLKNYKFQLNSKTKTPMEFDPNSFVLSVKGGVWLEVQKA